MSGSLLPGADPNYDGSALMVAPRGVLDGDAATTHTSQRDPVTEDVVVTNPCNGESVTLHIRQLFTLQR